MFYLTTYGKAFVFTVVIILLGILISLVWTNTKSPECEDLYNEYSNTTNVQMQQALLNKGVMNGCFNAN
jgi:hypothetical protein